MTGTGMNREDVPCGEDDGSGVIVDHDWPDADWPADQVRDRDDVTQCNYCGWTRLQLFIRAARQLVQHDVGCRYWNTGCEGDCDGGCK